MIGSQERRLIARDNIQRFMRDPRVIRTSENVVRASVSVDVVLAGIYLRIPEIDLLIISYAAAAAVVQTVGSERINRGVLRASNRVKKIVTG